MSMSPRSCSFFFDSHDLSSWFPCPLCVCPALPQTKDHQQHVIDELQKLAQLAEDTADHVVQLEVRQKDLTHAHNAVSVQVEQQLTKQEGHEKRLDASACLPLSPLFVAVVLSLPPKRSTVSSAPLMQHRVPLAQDDHDSDHNK